MFLKVGGKVPTKRRLYIFDIEMPSGIRVVKIGVASHGSSLDRMLIVNRDIFNKFRCTAKIRIKRDREVPADMVFKMETTLHKYFKNYQYISKVKFDGCTELFTIPLEDAVMAYTAVIDGNVPEHLYELPEPSVGDELPF